MKSWTLNKWRHYFRTADSSIFDIIEHAIMIAALDCPKEFRLRRDRIAVKLFTCKLTRCLGCDRIELVVPGDENDDGVESQEDEGYKTAYEDDRCQFESKGDKANSTCWDGRGSGFKGDQISNYSFGEAEALTGEIEEDSQIFREVLSIKEIVDNNQDESESVIFKSLQRLQLMEFSVETLKATEIGKAVNTLRKHGSKRISHLAGILIETWKDMVDEWYIATAAVAAAENTPESGKTSLTNEEEGEGLPSPPLDEGAFFATHTMELSQFFDGMDDNGNPQDVGEFNKNRKNGRKLSLDNVKLPKQEHIAVDEKASAKEMKAEKIKKQEVIMKKKMPIIKPNKLSSAESGSGRPMKLNSEEKSNKERKLVPKTEKVSVQGRPTAIQQDKLRCYDESSVQMKLEVTKRKLHERYQQAENAKRQRTIQVMELDDCPKQQQQHHVQHKNPHARTVHNRNNFAHVRHW